MLIDMNRDRSENVRYDYPDFPVYVRRALLSAYPNYAADSHWHDDLELVLILSGKMRYNINGEIVALNAGEGILVNTRQLHYGFSDDKTECEFICVLFHPVLLCTARSFAGEYVEPFLNSGAAYVRLSPETEWESKILRYIRGIYDCKDGRESPLYIQGHLCFLWSQLLSHTDVAGKGKSAAETKLSTLKAMIDYIHRHYSEKMTLDDIARTGNISKRTCSAVFLQYLNQTPMAFLTDYRLRKAIELLKTTDTSILEISLAVGFSGASYFAETFRKNLGMSPTEYRKAEGGRSGAF